LKNFFSTTGNSITVNVNAWVSANAVAVQNRAPRNGDWARIDVTQDADGNWNFRARTSTQTPLNIPQWFINTVVAIHSGEWSATTAQAKYTLHRDRIIEEFSLDTDSNVRSRISPWAQVNPDEGKSHASTFPFNGRNSRGGVVGLISGTQDRLPHRFEWGYQDHLKDDETQAWEILRKFNQMKVSGRHAPTPEELLGTFFHEVAAHAGQRTLGRPDIHGNAEVESLVRDIEDHLKPSRSNLLQRSTVP
jgi:hypothetical protein